MDDYGAIWLSDIHDVITEIMRHLMHSGTATADHEHRRDIEMLPGNSVRITGCSHGGADDAARSQLRKRFAAFTRADYQPVPTVAGSS